MLFLDNAACHRSEAPQYFLGRMGGKIKAYHSTVHARAESYESSQMDSERRQGIGCMAVYERCGESVKIMPVEDSDCQASDYLASCLCTGRMSGGGAEGKRYWNGMRPEMDSGGGICVRGRLGAAHQGGKTRRRATAWGAVPCSWIVPDCDGLRNMLRASGSLPPV